MVPIPYEGGSPRQQALVRLAVEQFLQESGGRYELVRSGPGEWRAEWQRQQPREQLVLATIYVERETEARAALIAALWGGLHGAGSAGAAYQTESHQ